MQAGERLTVDVAVQAIREDGDLAFVRNRPSGSLAEPREVFSPSYRLWARCDGSWISSARYFGAGFRPSLIGRWRIRRAFRARNLELTDV